MLPPTERAAMARRVAASWVSSVLSGVGRGQRPGVAMPSAATIPARTSGGRLAHAATRRARSVSGGALPVRPRPAPRLAPGAGRAAPGAARCSESAYSPGDSAGAWGFNSPRLHFSVRGRVSPTHAALISPPPVVLPDDRRAIANSGPVCGRGCSSTHAAAKASSSGLSASPSAFWLRAKRQLGYCGSTGGTPSAEMMIALSVPVHAQSRSPAQSRR